MALYCVKAYSRHILFTGMKQFSLFSIAVLTLLLLDSCQAHHRNAEVFFWTEGAGTGEETVWIDGKEIGSLPSIHDTLINRQLVIPEKHGLRITLPSGEYTVVVRNKNGDAVCKGSVDLDISEGSTDIHSSWNNDHCKMKVVW